MKRTIALSLCLAFVASVVFAFPPGMPPKENPLVSKVAPEDAGIVLTWQGTAPADASSTNKAEKALASSEVKEYFSKIEASIVENFGGNVIAKECFALALKNGACIYSLDSKENLAGMISLGANGPALVQKLTAAMNEAKTSGDISVSSISIGKMSFYKVLDSNGGKEFYWGSLGKDSVIVFANKSKGLVSVLNNARTPQPEWIANAKKEFGIERLSSLSGTTGKYFKENFTQNASADEDSDDPMKEFQKKFLGGEHLDRVVAASGLDETGSVQKTAIYMKDGWKKTLPGILIDKPLTNNDLSAIPSNANFALAGKTDLSSLLKSIAENEDLPGESKMQIAMLSMVVTPYLGSLGDSWRFFITEEDGVPGGALVWSLKNPAMAKIQLKQLMEMLKKNMQKTEMEIDDFGMNHRGLRVIPTQLQIFGDDEDEEDDNNNLPPNARIKIQSEGQIIIPDGQLPPGVVPLQVMPGGQIPQGAAPMGGGQIQLNGGNVDPTQLMGLIPESIEKIKIGSYDFWLLKNGEDNSNNIVIGIVGKNLVVTIKSYAEKYIEFDGTKNLSSNKAVARMMSNNPSYILYSEPKFFLGFVGGAVQASGVQLDETWAGMIVDSELPIIFGVYSTDDAVRVINTSGLPVPDGILLLFLFAH